MHFELDRAWFDDGSEDERGNHSDLAAASAAQCPDQVRFTVGVAVDERPSGRTTCALASESQVSPCRRPMSPSPPPRASPAIPTVGPHPTGRVRLCWCKTSYTRRSRAPAPITARPSPSMLIVSRRLRSSTTPSLGEERPARQCPPPRGTAQVPAFRAKATLRTTSRTVAHSTTAGGCASWNRAIAGRRASSYPGAPGVSTSPSSADWSFLRSATSDTLGTCRHQGLNKVRVLQQTSACRRRSPRKDW